MPYETDFDTAFTILLGKAQGTLSPTPGPAPTPTPTTQDRVVNVAFNIGADGTPLGTGTHLTVRLGMNGQARVLSWSLAGLVDGASTSGSVQVDIRTGSTVAGVSTICGGDEPELVSQAELSDQPVTGSWSPVIPDSRWVQARVTSVDGTLERVLLTLRVRIEAS